MSYKTCLNLSEPVAFGEYNMSVSSKSRHDIHQKDNSKFIPCDGCWESTAHSKEFYHQDHNALLMGELASLYQDSMLSDVVLKTSCGSTLHCHRLILAASSPYFRAMFTNGMAESRTDVISLPEVSGACLTTFLDYIYTGKITVSQDTAKDLAEAAGFLQLLDIQQVCFKFLEMRLDASNSLEVERVAERLYGRQLSEHAKQFSANHFMEITCTQEFYNYTKEDLSDLLIHELQVDSEEQIYEAIMKWVRRDVQERAIALPDLLENVAFEVMPTPYLTHILDRETLLEDNPDCVKILARIRMAAMKTDTTEQPKRTLEHPRNYSEVVIIFRDSVDSSATLIDADNSVLKSCVLQYDPTHNKWEDLPAIPLKLMYEYPASIATIQNNIIVITNKYRTWLYQSHHKAWSLLAQKFPPRNGGCLVSTGTDVYLVGGCSSKTVASVDTMLRFDKHVQQWKDNTTLPNPMSHVTGVCCQSNVYVIGSKSASHFVSEMLYYNPTKHQWMQCASMPIKLMRVEAVAINGSIFVLGQQNDFILDMCRYDTSKDTWNEMEGPLIARLGAATIVCNNKIYLIGGQSLKGDYMEEDEKTMETFDPQDGAWSIHSDMPFAISGHPAATILHPKHSPSRFLAPKQH